MDVPRVARAAIPNTGGIRSRGITGGHVAPVRPTGLSSAEAARRLARFGRNVLTPEERRGRRSPVLQAAVDPMVILLLIGGTIYLFLGDRGEAALLFAAVLPIVLMNLVLDLRAERTLAKLRELAAPRATVVRDGVVVEIPAEDLVPGDLLVLKEGDIVPGDATLVEAEAIQVDESSLTGESFPVSKRAAADPTSSTDVEERVFAGTAVTRGRGLALVVATGAATAYGEIGRLVAGAEARETPLQATMSHLLRWLGAVALVVCLVVVALELARGSGWENALLAGVSLAMAAIPEEFPIVFTLYLSLGVWRMARQHALIRRLASVEVLGATSVICTDKTGTVTEGRLAVAAVVPFDRRRDVVEAAILASDPEPSDPLDRALHEAAPGHALPPDPTRTGWQLLHRYGFDQRERLAAYVWRAPDGATWLFAKGAVEELVERAARDASEPRRFEPEAEALAARGERVLGVARRRLDAMTGDRHRDIADLDVMGLVSFVDPPRREVRAAIAECAAAGVRVVLVTGDHPRTALAIAEAIGLDHRGRVVSGGEIEQADDAELARLARSATVFARVLPGHKYRLVRALQARDEVVAMTGDGINDAPALKAADVGVAMGQRGTEAARAAASMVLLDDNFATIVTAIREGRRIFDNLQRAFSYLVAFHIPIVLTAFVIPLAGAPLLLLPVHLVWLELIVHPTASLLFEGDAPAPDLMRRPPRPRRSALLPRAAAMRALVEGLIITLLVAGLYLGWLARGLEEDRARGLGVLALVLGQMFLALAERAPDRPIWRLQRRGNVWLPLFVGWSILSLALILAFPPLYRLVRLAPPSGNEWLSLGVAVLAMGAAVEAVKATLRPRCAERAAERRHQEPRGVEP